MDNVTYQQPNLRASMRDIVRTCLDDGMKLSEAKQIFMKVWMEESLANSNNNQIVVASRENMHRNTVARLLKKVGVVPGKFKHAKPRHV
jgi:DNA-binding NtrC family response regulator